MLVAVILTNWHTDTSCLFSTSTYTPALQAHIHTSVLALVSQCQALSQLFFMLTASSLQRWDLVSNILRKANAVRGKRDQQDECSLSQQLYTGNLKTRLWQHSQALQKGMRVYMRMCLLMLDLWIFLVQVCLPILWACSIVNKFSLNQITVVWFPTSPSDTMTSSMLRRQLKNLVQNYSEAEVKVREFIV